MSLRLASNTGVDYRSSRTIHHVAFPSRTPPPPPPPFWLKVINRLRACSDVFDFGYVFDALAIAVAIVNGCKLHAYPLLRRSCNYLYCPSQCDLNALSSRFRTIIVYFNHRRNYVLTFLYLTAGWITWYATVNYGGVDGT